MKPKEPPPAEPFAIVRDIGLALPGVRATIKYDGSPVLKLDGCFMAGLAVHPSAVADTLVVRMAIEDRETLLDEAPETYYVTDYYRPHPIILARLSQLDREAVRDLLTVSWRLTAAKSRQRGRAVARPARRMHACRPDAL
jgi:hypothetical protein